MAKGKRGPRPQMKVENETGINIIEESFLPEDPTAEEIVGAENVVDVGEVDDEHDDDLPEPTGYKCADCKFRSKLLSEIEEHCNGTGHGGFKSEEPVETATQTALFGEPGVIHRNIEVPLDPVVLTEKRAKLAELYQEALEVKGHKKSADANFNAQLTAIDEDMQEIARVLKTPYTYQNVDCEWRVIEGENARGLYRLDTGECIETSPLTAEDRAKELDEANAANQEPVVTEETVPA